MTPAGAGVLASLRRVLAEERSTSSMLDATARAVVPDFAEWCVLDARGIGGEHALGVAVAHSTAQKEEVLRRAVEQLAPGERLLDASYEALHDRRTVVRQSGLPTALTGSATEGPPSERSSSSLVALPLLSRGRLVGVLTIGRGARAAYDAAELEDAEEIAARIATAVDLAGEAARVERAHESRNDMVSVLAHDLRTPLSTMAMVTARLKKNRAIGDLARSETTVLARSVGRIEGLLRNLVDCSRLESGQLRLERTQCDLAPLVQASLDAARAGAGGRVLDFDRPEGTFEVVGDPGRLRLVVDHLLANAIKFTADGGAVLARIARTSSEVVVAVTDNGFGIPPHKVEEIFVPSWQVPPEQRVPGQGPRLGLFVCRGLVEAQGGRLWVESAPGHGSTFSFSIPRADAVRARGAILVVDDDASFRGEVAELLRGEGFPVVSAPHGRAGLDYLRSHEPPSLVLLDLTMPVMDGWELYREMMRDTALASIPVVVVTGLSRTPAERALLDVPDYVEKPLSPERLLALAQRHVDGA